MHPSSCQDRALFLRHQTEPEGRISWIERSTMTELSKGGQNWAAVHTPQTLCNTSCACLEIDSMSLTPSGYCHDFTFLSWCTERGITPRVHSVIDHREQNDDDREHAYRHDHYGIHAPSSKKRAASFLVVLANND